MRKSSKTPQSIGFINVPVWRLSLSTGTITTSSCTEVKKAKPATTHLFKSGLRAEGSRFLSLNQPAHEITVVEICAAYWKHCQDYYVKDGSATSMI